MIQFEIETRNRLIWANFPNEPKPRASLLFELIWSLTYEGTPELYLERFAQVEADKNESVMRSFAVRTYISRARVLLEQAQFPDPAEESNPARTELSFEEARDLILRWRDVIAEWKKARSSSSL